MVNCPSQVYIQDKCFEVLLDNEEISKKIDWMADAISQYYKNKELVMVGVLNGAFMFFTDLVKAMKIDCTVSFVKVASYTGTNSSGKVRELIGFTGDLREKHVLLVDDILDSGFTMNFLLDSLKVKQPLSVKTACLLNKPNARKVDAQLDYNGFDIDNLFVVGYGLDYNGLGRTYNSIYKIKE